MMIDGRTNVPNPKGSNIELIIDVEMVCTQKDETFEYFSAAKNKKVRRFNVDSLFQSHFTYFLSVLCFSSTSISSIIIAIAHLRTQCYSIAIAFCLKFEQKIHL